MLAELNEDCGHFDSEMNEDCEHYDNWMSEKLVILTVKIGLCQKCVQVHATFSSVSVFTSTHNNIDHLYDTYSQGV